MTFTADQNKQLVQLLLLVNRLQLKAFNAESAQKLAFIIVNDTHQVFKYDRAFLYSIDQNKIDMIAISGQHTVNKETELYQKSIKLLSHMQHKDRPQILTEETFAGADNLWQEVCGSKSCHRYWLPIEANNQLRLGLWIETDITEQDQQNNTQEQLSFLYNTLVPGFATAWAKFDKNILVKSLARNRKFKFYALLTALIVLFGVRVPLRVAAPCEVVAEKPYVITAPLEGIIDHVAVKPGQGVKIGDLLFEYDRKVPDQEFKTAAKQMEVSREEFNRGMTLGLSDPKSLSEVQVLKLRAQKDEIAYELAKQQQSQLDVEAPIPGIIVMDDPDDWRGRPVKIGEKVLSISDPAKTKIRLWIPESDNVKINPEIPLQITLNVTPDINYTAKLSYIAFESQIGEGEIPAFLGEAHWETPPDVKLGLRGTAILYGDNVSLFYFIVRKPWSTFRRFTGI
jgi:biotin carboxyl carrier protein